MAQPATTAKIEELRFKLKTDPKSRLFYQLAEELRKAGHFDESEHVLRTGLVAYPTYLAAWVSLGRTLREQKNDAAAVDALDCLVGAFDTAQTRSPLPRTLCDMSSTKPRLVRGWRHGVSASHHGSGLGARRSTPGKDPMSKHAAFVTSMDKMMVRWDKEVDALARRTGNGANETGDAYQECVKELRACRDDAQKMFQEIRFAGEHEGAQLKDGMQAAWVKMQATLEKVNATLLKK